MRRARPGILLRVHVALLCFAGVAGVAGVAGAQNRMVDTDGAIDLAGAVVLPSKWAVLLLVLGMVLVSVLGAVLALRVQERREAEEALRRLEERLARKDAEIERLHARLGDPIPSGATPGKSSDVST